MVSHDRHFIDQVIDHVLSIDRAKIQLFAGNYETWAAEYQRENQSELAEKQHLQKEIGRLKATANTMERWAGHAEGQKQKSHQSDQHARIDKGFIGHKAAKVMKRSKNTLRRTEKDIEVKQSLLKNVDEVAPLKLNSIQPPQKYLLQVDGLQVQQAGTILNQPLSFDLKRGQRLILFGPNGMGKTTIVNAIMGDKELLAGGTVTRPASLRISYLSQNFEDLKGSIQSYADQFGIELNDLLNTLRKLGFERVAFNEDLKDLSMGQKRKISLARSLCEPANLYIWDEPLNYLDVITRKQIQDLILQKRPSMLIIDHDEAFIEAVKTAPLLKIAPIDSQ